MTDKKTRGERNCNLGNVRCSTQKFLGEVSPSTDTEFKTFTDYAHGIRAIAKILLTYYRKHGIDTIRGIISRWAPSSENDTNSYVNSVSLYTGLEPDKPFKVDDRQNLILLVRSIVRHENGRVSCTQEDIEQGVDLALG